MSEGQPKAMTESTGAPTGVLTPKASPKETGSPCPPQLKAGPCISAASDPVMIKMDEMEGALFARKLQSCPRLRDAKTATKPTIES